MLASRPEAMALGPPLCPLQTVPQLDSTMAVPSRRSALAWVLVGTVQVFLVASPARAQTDPPEPILDQVQELLRQPGFRLGFLVQAVADPGLGDTPARMVVGQARIRIGGDLDGGFSYWLQTNHVGPNTLLDAIASWSPDARLMISAGRFKTPFSREFIEYAANIDFVNRSRVVVALAPNRQYGLRLSGDVGSIVTWTLGGFSGSTLGGGGEPLLGVARLEGSGISLGGGTLAVAGQFAGGRGEAIGRRPFDADFEGDGVLFGVDGRYEVGALLLAGEYILGAFDPLDGEDVDSDGFFVTTGWMLTEKTQALLRWDRFRSPGADGDDDILVLGFNAWPTGASEVQANWVIPVAGSPVRHRILVSFQIGIN
jgi:hypothetical protein